MRPAPSFRWQAAQYCPYSSLPPAIAGIATVGILRRFVEVSHGFGDLLFGLVGEFDAAFVEHMIEGEFAAIGHGSRRLGLRYADGRHARSDSGCK